ncbi:MAG: hypothetical protein QXZ02_06030 [Candidatus Bathyarchaeia archaeon]
MTPIKMFSTEVQLITYARHTSAEKGNLDLLTVLNPKVRLSAGWDLHSPQRGENTRKIPSFFCHEMRVYVDVE